MIRFTTGNIFEADVHAIVNTVNTVGVMGKGIALMFKDKFPENFQLYKDACSANEIAIGHMFITENMNILGPKWIVNFPTKKHWRNPSKIEWIKEGLRDLKTQMAARKIRSIAIPPLGAGNGGLEWNDVKSVILAELAETDVDILVYEPIDKYQNVAKKEGVEKLTPARAIIAELVRRYWILGIECTLLEVQKLAWFAERVIEYKGLQNPLDLQFKAHTYGPYANRLSHLLNSLDGSYLHCDKRIGDAGPFDVVWFEDRKTDKVAAYLSTDEADNYDDVVYAVSGIIDGFESPLGMELLSTVDWLLSRESVRPNATDILEAIAKWPGGEAAAKRKAALFDRRLVELALSRLTTSAMHA